MGLWKYIAVALLAIGLSVPPSGADAKATAKQVEKAATADELIALGATKLSAAQFKQMIVGKPLSNKKQGWSWIIDANGTTSSSAADGSWKEENAPWKMKGDDYCTKNEGCRSVFLIGNLMRMSDKSDATKLSAWTVSVGK
ncbi:MAG: hypothetical protein DI533_09490 [Cereibacter sphaeroides]|uniref:DUF995 domain-containing protein n=1 Tax=Cereibacter sphaeroides TaxID=1063 RepID=A0A2W5UBJ4_CERSP|nr:MAG: hypothetical protein DI533_09490 [Cereibacter sphaeroides]